MMYIYGELHHVYIYIIQRERERERKRYIYTQERERESWDAVMVVGERAHERDEAI